LTDINEEKELHEKGYTTRIEESEQTDEEEDVNATVMETIVATESNLMLPSQNNE
jgi:hypothetical protein